MPILAAKMGDTRTNDASLKEGLRRQRGGAIVEVTGRLKRGLGRRDGGFDLAPEVARFVDEEAVGVCEVGEDVLFEAEDLVLLHVVFGGEGVQGLEVFG